MDETTEERQLFSGLDDVEYRETFSRNGNADGAPDDWPEPREPEIPKIRVPAFPAELLPSTLAPWILDEAERMGVDPALIAIPAMIGLGSVLGTGVSLTPKERDPGFQALASTWGCVVARPGAKKTPAQMVGLAPVYELQRVAREVYQNESAAVDAQRENLDAELGLLKAKLKRELRQEDSSGAEKLSFAIRDMAAQREALSAKERVFFTNDATVEALAVVCAENPRGVLVTNDELARTFESFDRSGHEGDRPFYLAGWQGRSPYDTRRITRKSQHVDRLSLAVYGGTQPDVLGAYLRDATGTSARNDGLLQRVQLLVWPDDGPVFAPVDRDANYRARDEASAIFETLAHRDFEAEGPRLVNGIPALRFDSDAQQLGDAFQADLEKRLREDDELLENPALASHLAKYRSLMPGLALLTHLAEAAPAREFGNPVSLHAAQRAAALCEFFEAHARKVYGPVRPADNPTERLRDEIERGAIRDRITLREIYRRELRGLASAEAVRRAFAPLIEAGWARLESVASGAVGGRPAEIVRVNPRLHRG